MKIALAGQGAFGIKHLEAMARTSPASRWSRWPAAGPRAPRTSPRSGRSRTGPPTSRESLKQPGVEAVILASPTQMHAEQAEHVHARRQACADRDSDGRHARRFASASCRSQKETGVVAMAGHVRRFNPEPSMGPQEDQGRRAQDPADGRADLFLPPHQHERARPAAQLDRPSAVASRLPHRRSVPVPDRRAAVDRACGAGADASRARRSPWT